MDRVGGSITEGIGQGRVTENLKPEIEAGLIDDAVFISDEDSILMVYRMLDEEGIYLGASSALNVAAGQYILFCFLLSCCSTIFFSILG